MPTAKTPTAIETTTSTVRDLVFQRSRRTLAQRGLIAGGVLYLRRAMPDDPLDCILGHARLFEEGGEGLTVERPDFTGDFGRGAPHYMALACLHQRHRAEMLADSEPLHDDFLPVGP